jgi:hypothetical protein
MIIGTKQKAPIETERKTERGRECYKNEKRPTAV